MAYDLENKLVIGISTRALFDLTKENQIFVKDGAEAYCSYQKRHENEILKPGPGFSLIDTLLSLNELPGNAGRVEVIIVSRNSADISLRIFHSVRHYGMNITRAVLTSGASIVPYLKAFKTDLFLSADEEDVQSAINLGMAAAVMINNCAFRSRKVRGTKQLRIAFDGDAVLFADESEQIFARDGLRAFEENERKLAKKPLQAGPFAKLCETISKIQKEFAGKESPVRTALVTSRCAPAHERVIRTLRAWNVRIDEVFFLGGISKKEVLREFGASIFFDDQMLHALAASEVVPAARVPYKVL